MTTETPISVQQDAIGSPALPTGTSAAGLVWQLLPHGTVFAVPVTVTLPFDPTVLPAGTAPHLYKAQPGGTYAEVTPITVSGNFITAQVSSFSYFVVAAAHINKAPTAVLSMPAGSALTGQVLSFAATGSSDPEGAIASYRWSFGDGSVAQEGPRLTALSHSFSTAGIYTVSLTVADAQGANNIAVATISITAPVSNCTAPQVLSGGVCMTPNQSPTANVLTSKTTAFVGDVVTLNPDGSSDADGHIVSYSWSFSDGSASITTATPIVQSKSWATAGSQTVTLTVTDNQGASNQYAVMITVSATITSASPLTDTGITANQCYAAGSNARVSCTSATALALNDKQDGMLGRDVTSPSDTDGKLGFSYSQVPNPAGGNFAVTECVKDNITGLTWEGKTATGTRAGSVTYTNYDNTAEAQFLNGTFVNPTQVQIDASSNAVGYKNAVNTSALCGYTDWRLPTADELQSLVDYSVYNLGPAIDTTWFPNTSRWAYWSATPVVGNAPFAWIVVFELGKVDQSFRYDGLGRSYYPTSVRLVR
jgi:PKD repeat protein